MLTPLAVGPGQPFPYISALSLSLGVFVRDPKTRRGTLRAGQGARAPAPLHQRRQAPPLPAPRARDHVLAHVALPEDGDHRMRAVPRHEGRRLRGLRRSGRPAGSGRAGVAATAVRRHGPRRDLRLDVRRDAEAHQGGPRCARRPGLPRRRAARPRRPQPDRRPRPPRSQGRALAGRDPAAPRRPDDRRRALRRDQARGHPRPPPVRVVRDERRDVRPGRGARPGRDRDQDDGVPHERRVAARSRPDRGRRRRQADRVPRRAEGALRRAAEHRVVTRAGAIGSARRLRLPDPEDARQDDARRPARGKRACGGTSTSAPATTTL